MLGLKGCSSGDAPAGSVPSVVPQPSALAVSGIASTQGAAAPSLEWEGERAAVIAQRMLRDELEASRAPGLCLSPIIGKSRLVMALCYLLLPLRFSPAKGSSCPMLFAWVYILLKPPSINKLLLPGLMKA